MLDQDHAKARRCNRSKNIDIIESCALKRSSAISCGLRVTDILVIDQWGKFWSYNCQLIEGFFLSGWQKKESAYLPSIWRPPILWTKKQVRSISSCLRPAVFSCESARMMMIYHEAAAWQTNSRCAADNIGPRGFGLPSFCLWRTIESLRILQSSLHAPLRQFRFTSMTDLLLQTSLDENRGGIALGAVRTNESPQLHCVPLHRLARIQLGFLRALSSRTNRIWLRS